MVCTVYGGRKIPREYPKPPTHKLAVAIKSRGPVPALFYCTRYNPTIDNGHNFPGEGC